MTELSTFNPQTVDDLVAAISGDVAGIGGRWWSENSQIIPGYFRSLAEATLQTQEALAAGIINEESADRALRMQQAAFRQTINFMKYMTLVLSQKIVDAVFTLVGWAVFNRTGINFFPELVKPE